MQRHYARKLLCCEYGVYCGITRRTGYAVIRVRLQFGLFARASRACFHRYGWATTWLCITVTRGRNPGSERWKLKGI